MDIKTLKSEGVVSSDKSAFTSPCPCCSKLMVIYNFEDVSGGAVNSYYQHNCTSCDYHKCNCEVCRICETKILLGDLGCKSVIELSFRLAETETKMMVIKAKAKADIIEDHDDYWEMDSANEFIQKVERSSFVSNKTILEIVNSISATISEIFETGVEFNFH